MLLLQYFFKSLLRLCKLSFKSHYVKLLTTILDDQYKLVFIEGLILTALEAKILTACSNTFNLVNTLDLIIWVLRLLISIVLNHLFQGATVVPNV